LNTIKFTDHAKRKFEILRRLGFPLTKEHVIMTVEEPEKVERGWKNRFIAIHSLNTEHVLRVVYEKVEDVNIIVTFYPARRKRYEDEL